MLAIELGRRNIRCLLVDAKLGTAFNPQANATQARTMEHFRRLGFAHEIRSMGLPPDHATDIAYLTRFAGTELARLRLADCLAVPATGGKLSADQAADVLTPLFTARQQTPPLPEVYELIAEVWARCAVTPTRGHLAVVSEGVTLFPRRAPLVHRAAALFLEHGHVPEASSLAPGAAPSASVTSLLRES